MCTDRSRLTLVAIATVFFCIALTSGVAAADSVAPDATGNDTEELLVFLETPEHAVSDHESVEAQRKAATDAAVAPLSEFAAGQDGMTIERHHWTINAVLVTVEHDRIDRATVSEIQNVDRVTENPTVSRPTPTTTSEAPQSSTNSITQPSGTYGLEMINAIDTWYEHGTRGAGTRITVLDSGVDADHPDIDVASWRDFDDDPSKTPIDYGEHGTHVTGIITGGDHSGKQIGVAPDARVSHGAVLTQCFSNRCVGSVSDVVSGIEWAVESDADVVTMSLGIDGYADGGMIEAVRTAEEAGTLVVSSSGNSGAGSSASPGNYYDSFAVGAVDQAGEAASFSSSEEINTTDAWEGNAPSHWPDQYTVPDVTGPGVAVYSAVPGDEYERFNGTSMAAPHVAGSTALLQSITDDQLDPDELRRVLIESAEISGPSGENPEHRHGAGIIDTYSGAELATEGSTVDIESVDLVNATAGETAKISTSINNPGILSQNASLSIRSSQFENRSHTIELNGGESTTVTTSFETSRSDIGQHEITIDSDNTTKTVQLTVRDPNPVTVDHIEHTEYVFDGENASVTIDITNDGEELIEETISVGGENSSVQEQTREVALRPGDSEQLQFNFETQGLAGSDPTLFIEVGEVNRSIQIAVIDPQTVHRSVEGTVVPGSTVTVTLRYQLRTESEFEVIENFEPEIVTDENSQVDVTVEDEQIPLMASLIDEGQVLALPRESVGPGELRIEYTIGIPDTATQGDEFKIVDSIFRADGQDVETAGEQAVTVTEPSVSDYAGSTGRVDDSNLFAAIDDWRADIIDSALLLDVIDAWRDDEVVADSFGS